MTVPPHLPTTTASSQALSNKLSFHVANVPSLILPMVQHLVSRMVLISKECCTSRLLQTLLLRPRMCLFKVHLRYAKKVYLNSLSAYDVCLCIWYEFPLEHSLIIASPSFAILSVPPRWIHQVPSLETKSRFVWWEVRIGSYTPIPSRMSWHVMHHLVAM